MTKINIVNHTHWDREWYFTTMDTLVLSDQVFTEVLDELECNKDAKFCLDGQISILEEYLEVNPESLEQIKKFVSEGRLSIGPWYTQTDDFLVSGESIIRNIALGIHETEKIGKHMQIGYLPDTFGFNAQMPTILKNSGIDNIIFWRGINFEKHIKSPYFIWKGLGDEYIYAINLVDGYGGGARLNTSEEFKNKKLFPLVNKIKKLTNLEEILIPAGGDQLDIIHDLNDKLYEINKTSEDIYSVSSYEEFANFIRRNKEKLETYEGEFREPAYSRVHKSIGSVRYDIKKTNFELEQLLLNRIEPLYAIAKGLDIHISKNLINTAWKKIMEGQAHDGMGGCITDDVARDVLYRMKQSKEICDALENLIKKKISEGIGLKENEIIVFNTLPYEYNGYKIVEFMSKNEKVYLNDVDDFRILSVKQYEGKKDMLIEAPEGNYYINEDPYVKVKALVRLSLPAMGYRVFEVMEGESNKAVVEKDLVISNDFYKISILDNKICLELANGKVIEDFIFFEDCGNDGDTYDFSPLRNDKPIYFRVIDGIKEVNGSIQKLILSGKKILPKNLQSRISKEELEELDVKLEITLTKEAKLICYKIIIDNNIDSHRLRVAIKSDINACESIASVPFGYIKRPILNGNLPEDWMKSYVEMPIDIEVFESTVAITNEEYTMSVYSKGIKEYQVINDDIYLTLLATTGELGKPNLLYRPGRASGDTTKKGHIMIPTPLAQQHGIKKFEFAVALEMGGFDGHLVEKRYEAYTAQNISYQIQTLNKFIYRLDNKIQPTTKKVNKLERKYSLLSLDNNIVFSSIAPSLKDNALLLRLKNSTEESIELNKKDFSKFSKFSIVNNIEIEQEKKDLIIKPFNTLTIKLWY